MARRRYISTEISIDKAVNRLAVEYGDFAALLYTWMIPHAEDTCLITADPFEIKNKVMPARTDKTEEDVQHAIDGMIKLGLVSLIDGKILSFPPESFYKYQTYIPEKKRRTSPQNTEEHRYPSHSPIPNLTYIEEEEERAREGEVFKFFNQNIGLITPFQAEHITKYLDEDGFEPKMVLEILRDSIGMDNKWGWIKAVLHNSVLQNVKTLEQYQSKKAERGNKKGRDAPKRTASFLEMAKEMMEDEQE
ncbi:replication initiation and membrane attachment [Ruminiclostridium hungatei]|uniref:Replication initiation and membrane attachment n=1 Tax=Ruminiclostridium hungatei TaxID=48256 RepID=A0A1V4SR74_RUMHU|nr:DnaD domain protein [Ruminiclostridium hungatei]OPX46354.1 replication initiation and membrane attachment [Ruminiclostridium hungatei]